MKGTELSYQERECRLYNLFDKFAYVQGETMYEYYWRFSQLINDMHTIGMTMQQFQVNTKFLNAFLSEWSKFVTDVKLAKSLYTTNYDQLYAYLIQHERHANEVRIMRERYLDPFALVANSPTLYNPSQSPNIQVLQFSPQPFISPSVTQHSQVDFPQLDFGLAVPTFQRGKDLIECINKAMAFLSAVASRFPPSNNQLRTSSDPRNQETIQDGRVTVQQVQGRHSQSFASTGNRGIATTSRGNYAGGQPRVVKCYNCQGEGHMARQYLDAYDSDCDDLSSAKAVLMENLSSCDSDVLSEVPYSDSSSNDMINQDESQDAVIHDTNSSTPNDLLVLSLVEQMTNHVAHLDKENQTNKMTLILEAESQLKMLDKQNDPISIENKIKISPIDYSKLNKIKEDFGKRFVTKKELSAEQAFWLKHSSFSKTPVTSHTPVRIEAPSELPKVSLVNESLKKLKYQLANFDKIVKKRTTSDAITAGAWGFEHTKACFVIEIIPFLKVLKDTFNAFDKTLLDEITEVQTIFNQMEAVVDNIENELRKLKRKNVVDTAVSKPSATIAPGMFKLDIEPISHRLKNNRDAHEVYIEKNIENTDTLYGFVERARTHDPSEPLLESACMFTKYVQELDKRVRFAEPVTSSCNIPKQTDSLKTKDSNKPLLTSTGVKLTTSASGSKPSGNTKNNRISRPPSSNQKNKVEDQSRSSQEKDTVIRKLKDRIKSLSGKNSVENVKKDIDEIETINIELEHSVAKLLLKNKNLRKEREHLKSFYKDHFDLIRKTHIQSKEHCYSLIAQINAKSIENSDLNAQLQEKVFAITALKNELRKLKGKNVVDTANNRDAHVVYIEKATKNTDTLCGFVERARTQNPSKPLLESACMFTKHVQELLVYVSQTCPISPKPSEKLVAVTPTNKDKRVRFSKLVTSSSNIAKQTDSLKTKDSNKPLLTSTGVKPTTSVSESKPSGNTKNNWITRPPSSNHKNKVEDHSRKVKSSFNKMNFVSKLVSNALVKHSVRNAKFKSTCAICRTFTIVGNKFPLTRITSTKVVPTKETSTNLVATPTQGILVYSRKPKATRFVGSTSKVKIIESKTSNSKEPKQSWGSTVSDIPSSSLNDYRFGNDHIVKIMGYGDYQMGNVTISWVYYVEGLGHNLFSVGQFCDSELSVVRPLA
ncbi:retrovirus-related pol polyprotein from transposon TNT 1-94 [Tanacetum coccineum]